MELGREGLPGPDLASGTFLRVPSASNHFCPWLLQDCYILDQSGTKIYVWKGRGATKTEKQMAMSKALVGAPGPAPPCPKRPICSASEVSREPDGVLELLASQLHTRLESDDLGVNPGLTYISWGGSEDSGTFVRCLEQHLAPTPAQ